MSHPEGFEAFYSAGYARVVRSVWMLTGNMEEAEDLAQEAFGRAYARWAHVSTHPEPEAWVKLVAFNLARSRFRRASLAAKRIFVKREEDGVHDAAVVRIDLERAMRQLPERQRAA